MDTDNTQISLTKEIHCVHLNSLPFMPAVFCRLLALSLVRKQEPAFGAGVQKGQLILSGFVPDPDRIRSYRKVCGFSCMAEEKTIPASCLQTFFIGILGRYITSDFFPVNPMGLIQTGQSFTSIQPVFMKEPLDLSCTLKGMTRTAKGIFTRFCLEIHRENTLVWEGTSTYLTRNPAPGKGLGKKIQERPLPAQMTIQVPENAGRRYARVSGDYNPHHLFNATARLIGFKKAIAHGMWSLARTLAALERNMIFSHPFAVDAAFKLPIFMPATLTLGYENIAATPGQVRFELRDAHKGLPHLKGTLHLSNREK